MRKGLIVLFTLLLSLFAMQSAASGAVTITKAEWRADRQKLDLRAQEGNGSETLTATYNGQTHTMTYKADKQRYELKLEPVCYAGEVTVVSTSGAAASQAVVVKEGSASGLECSTTGDDSGGEEEAPPAGGVIDVTKAEWRADKQKLDLRAQEGNGSETLTANYNGQPHTMTYKADKQWYELKLEPVCYAKEVTIVSTSGATTSQAVVVKEGSSAGFECNNEGNICPDADGDGFADAACGGTDCNDADSSINPGTAEVCGDGIDQDCNGADEACVCPDADGDGFADAACGGTDCNDADSSINPGTAEVCGDGIDQDCNGADLQCASGPHGGLTYQDYPAACISCHQTEAGDMMGSTHYQWLGEAPDMVNGVGVQQGKLTNSINSYCINIEGDWSICGKCHAGRGLRPDDPGAGLDNIDCLVCHSEEYAAVRTRLSDGSMGVVNPTDSMVRNVQKPTRANCLNCHAKAGGGDAVKRGDLSMATITNADPQFDVHMNTSGSDLSCQSCHVFQNHKVIGKGSDLRPTDDPSRGAEVKCTTCHVGKDGATGHLTAKINDHVARIACQTCHIPTYAKVATETHRDWRTHQGGTPADGVSGPGHPYTDKAAGLTPEYKWWNRLSDNYLLGDDASRVYDPALDTYPTSRPLGGIEDGKIYPFKYKTAIQPKTVNDDRLIALDTLEYLGVSGDAVRAVENGLVNMGYPADTAYEWVTTDTYQLLNHGVDPASGVLQCSNCHQNTSRMDLKGELGYALKGSLGVLCVQCHSYKNPKPFESMHDLHVTRKKYDCSWCHGFSRPERGLRMP